MFLNNNFGGPRWVCIYIYMCVCVKIYRYTLYHWHIMYDRRMAFIDIFIYVFLVLPSDQDPN